MLTKGGLLLQVPNARPGQPMEVFVNVEKTFAESCWLQSTIRSPPEEKYKCTHRKRGDDYRSKGEKASDL